MSLNNRKAQKVFDQLSPSSKQFATLSILQYAFQKICPDLCLAMMAREKESQKYDGVTAEVVALKEASRLASTI